LLWILLSQKLEHGIFIRRFFWDGLLNIPVFDDLAILQAKDIDNSSAAVIRSLGELYM